MNTTFLKYAVEIEQAGSISKAASKLYIAQPNLSKMIKDAEDELGYTIFQRTSTGIRVTEKGDMFLYHAKKVLEQMEEIEKIASGKTDTNSVFKLSIPRGSYIANGFTAFIREMQMNSNTELTINETNASRTIANVADRGYNMGIVRYPVSEDSMFEKIFEHNNLIYETIWEFEYNLVMSKDNPLNNNDVVSVEDLKNYVRITHGDIEHAGEKGLVTTPLDNNDQRQKIIYVYERGSQFDLLASVPNTYMWVSPIPTSYLEKNNLIQRSCSDTHRKYKDVLIYRKDYVLTENDKLFQKKLYESKVEVASLKIS